VDVHENVCETGASVVVSVLVIISTVVRVDVCVVCVDIRVVNVLVPVSEVVTKEINTSVQDVASSASEATLLATISDKSSRPPQGSHAQGWQSQENTKKQLESASQAAWAISRVDHAP
jgi:hypothetical protein